MAAHMENDNQISEKNQRTETGTLRAFIGELVRFALIALLIVVPIRVFIAQPYIVSGASMHPTFENGDYLIVDQLSYRLEKPTRGDVVIFRYPDNPSKFFIKRVVGLPNETVIISGGQVTIVNEDYPAGTTLPESYLTERTTGITDVTLNEHSYYVLGDNRDESLDSRIFGPLPENLIVGKPFIRLLPIFHAGYQPGSVQATN